MLSLLVFDNPIPKRDTSAHCSPTDWCSWVVHSSNSSWTKQLGNLKPIKCDASSKPVLHWLGCPQEQRLGLTAEEIPSKAGQGGWRESKDCSWWVLGTEALLDWRAVLCWWHVCLTTLLKSLTLYWACGVGSAVSFGQSGQYNRFWTVSSLWCLVSVLRLLWTALVILI